MTDASSAALAMMLAFAIALARADVNVLKVSYDPTREAYQDSNEAFAK